MVWRPILLSSLLAAPLLAVQPLHVSERNPRYFSDGAGVVYLTGAHTWNTIADMSPSEAPAAFDFTAFLDWVTGYGHNFTRLWTWELTIWDTSGNNPRNRTRVQQLTVAPLPWRRTGPAKALDGKLKFDLTRYDPNYFDRLRKRASEAGERGVYVSVMLFEGWGLQRIKGAWEYHPMNPANNVNGIDGDANGDGIGVEVHELVNPKVTSIQEAYVRKTIDTLNDLDNVLYEISNENHPASTAWQYHMIRFIHDYERTKPKQHPVGMTFQFKGGSNRALFESPAEWISPNPEGGYRDNPPPATGKKVILSDTDHLWGIGGNVNWVWKSFTRGLNPLFMDPYRGVVLSGRSSIPFDAIRRAMGQTRKLAERIDLAEMEPRDEIASSGYCLAKPGGEYVVYLPGGGTVSVVLPPGQYRSEWIDPVHGEPRPGPEISGGGRRLLTAPGGGAAVLYLKKR